MAGMIERARSSMVSPFAWNDIEMLPIYAAAVIGLHFLWMLVAELTTELQVSAIKAAGVFGCLALRHAWLQLEAETDSQPRETQ